MPGHVIIVEKRSDFRWADPQNRVVTLGDYLKSSPDGAGRRRKVVNFCRDTSYLGAGYYCSLLAEARGEFVIVIGPPQDQAQLSSDDLDALLRDALDRLSVKEAVAETAALTGAPRRLIYQRALALRGD